jgi:DAK2 domain fusion protein YloV
MQLKVLDGAHLRQMIYAGTALLEERKQEVNALNVFPVPDGDTGTNMGLTVAAAVREIEKGGRQLSQVAGALAMGSLMGARGNSGVILSQLFRGFSDAIGDKDIVTPIEFAQAMQKGVETAYRAVMKPVEGTILTVAKEGAKVALQSARRGDDIIGVMKMTIQKAALTLERTPEMLPVLKEAGVVDAGGKGLLLILEGALLAVLGEAKYESIETDFKVISEPDETVMPGQGLDFQYCTEFILKGTGLDLDGIRDSLGKMGDSLIAVGTENLVKVHIHSNHPGKILELGLRLGTLHDIKIDNMAEQHREAFGFDEAGQSKTTSQENTPQRASETDPKISIISVAVGTGIKAILHSLGVQKVVEGGQTMNPSTEDLVRSIEECSSDEVIILPNNKNIILSAQQAQDMVSKKVLVIPTKNITQGISALVAYNPLVDIEENAREMTEALHMVQTGEITYAIRDSRYNGREIKAGDILGLIEGELIEVGREPEETALDLLNRMVGEESEIITLYYGQDRTMGQGEELAEEVMKLYPQCEVEVYDGGQPLYYYIISVE